ncbi:MAG: hypothetical protein HYX32_09945 [Actinobacteria bacterium]|nr:hypothetical protein [Actinomycetota bacterium]
MLGVDVTSPSVIGAEIEPSLLAAAFAVLDLSEAVHGLRENEPAIGVLALVIAALHATAAVITFPLLDQRPSRDRSASPGNLLG